MLLRFNSIEEIGRFATLHHRTEQLSRLSLIYARNGYGKSTICAILRSASEGQPRFIEARRRLGAKRESRVQTLWSPDSTVAFNGGKWNDGCRKVYVFDHEFALQNLHIGDSVTTANKRSLLPVVLGEEGVALSRKVTELDREQRDLDNTTREAAAIIRAKAPVVGVNEYIRFSTRELPSDIDAKVALAMRDLELAKNAVAVRQKKPPSLLPIETLEYFREIAARTIDTVSQNAADRVKHHMERHHLTPNGERWLRYGLDRLAEDACPFCDQSTKGLDLIAAYQGYFSDAFAKLISDRDEAISSITAIRDAALKEVVDEINSDLLFWGTVCALPQTPALSEAELSEIDAGLESLAARLREKIKNPLAVVEVDDASVELAFELIKGFNSALEACLPIIEAARSSVATANAAAAEDSLRRWQAISARREEPLLSATAKYAEAQNRKDAIKTEKEAAQAAVKTYASKVIQTRQDDINELLETFGANFKIVDARASFAGREPNTDFAIKVNSHTIPASDSSDSEPTFKTVLSAGDKSTLALALFIVQVRAAQSLSEAVIVFDDPFSSQDRDRQFETASQIRALAKTACQTIVLSHDPRFLQLIERDAEHSMTRTFQLMCTDQGAGQLSAWSSVDELEALYVRQSEMIREYASQGKLLNGVTLASLIQNIRPFLEDYIRHRYPGRFTKSDHLAMMVDQIRIAGPSDPLSSFVAALTALNEYTRPNMHGGGLSPDPTELRVQCKRVVSIVGAY